MLPFGGLYIAGGILKKNIGVFNKKVFMEEFLLSRQKEVLQRVPVHIVLNRDIALYGAANYLVHFSEVM